MTALENMIRTYAFTHDCDLDEATRRVLAEIVRDYTYGKRYEGLFDRLFSREGNDA